MPYQWTQAEGETSLTLWPHQSMTPPGFVWFIGATAIMFSLPLLAVLGSAVAWVLMLFFVTIVVAVWRAINANQRARSLHETLTLEDGFVRLEHVPLNGPVLKWEANSHWVTVNLRRDGPVEDYLTLRGGGREVELGRFLTPEERLTLRDELVEALAQL